MYDTRNQKLPQATLFSLESTKSLIHGHDIGSDIILLKGAALLYPKIVLHTQVGYNQLCEQVTQGLNEKQKSNVRGFLKSNTALAHKDHIVKIISETGMFDHNLIVANVEWMVRRRPPGGYIDLDAIDYINPISFFYINQFLNLPYYEKEKIWENFESKFLRSNFKINSDELITTAIPNIENLDWESILELRKSPFANLFRNFMFGAYRSKDELLEKIENSLWEVVGATIPSTGKSIRKIIANIPIIGTAFPNPYAVYRDIKEIMEDKNASKKYGWLFFIQQAKMKKNNS